MVTWGDLPLPASSHSMLHVDLTRCQARLQSLTYKVDCVLDCAPSQVGRIYEPWPEPFVDLKTCTMPSDRLVWSLTFLQTLACMSTVPNRCCLWGSVDGRFEPWGRSSFTNKHQELAFSFPGHRAPLLSYQWLINMCTWASKLVSIVLKIRRWNIDCRSAVLLFFDCARGFCGGTNFRYLFVFNFGKLV